MTCLPKFWFRHGAKTGVTKKNNSAAIQHLRLLTHDHGIYENPSQNTVKNNFKSRSNSLNIPLPKLAITKSPLPQIQIFLSHLTPNMTDITKIILLPTPSEALLKNLLKCPKNGQSQSFVCEHQCVTHKLSKELSNVFFLGGLHIFYIILCSILLEEGEYGENFLVFGFKKGILYQNLNFAKCFRHLAKISMMHVTIQRPRGV